MHYLARIFISGILLVFFSYLLNFYQELYNDSNTSFVKTISLAAIILYGGFTYDMCKNIIFMPARRFEVFKNRFKELAKSVGVLLVLILATALVISLRVYGFEEAHFFGAIVFIPAAIYTLTVGEKVLDIIEAS